MPLKIIRHDITQIQTDAIVNATNPTLQPDANVSRAIFAAAGAAELRQACDRIGRCDPGQAVLTAGFALPARHIIHTAAPVWRGGSYGERDLLYSCCGNSLALARDSGCTSIAFPLLAFDADGYPQDQALRTAAEAIGDFLTHHDMDVVLVVSDQESFALSEKLYNSLQSFIDDNYADEYTEEYSAGYADELSGAPSDARLKEHPGKYPEKDSCYETLRYDGLPENSSPLSGSTSPVVGRAARPPQPTSGAAIFREKIFQQCTIRGSLDDALSRLDETFSQALLHLIDQKGRTDAEVYKRANIDRRLFSKIRSNPAYKPGKNTVIAFAVALELSLDETRDLLLKAGYALSRSSRADVIVEYFIRNGNYNIFEINEALFAFEQSLLGA